MSVCEKYKKNLVLYFYDELDEVENADLEAHLHVCKRCQEELQELKNLEQTIPQKPFIKPDDATLQLMRNVLSQKIRAQTKAQSEKKFTPFTSITPRPVFQAGFAILLLAFGFVIGRQTIGNADQNQETFQNLIAANQQVQAANSEINPLLAGVEKVKFNSQTGEVEVYYTTVNDIQLNGDLNSPTIRQMLSHAMLEEENPSVRLHAVKALKVFAEEKKLIEPELIGSIETLLNKEDNLGIRLQAIKLLNVLPLNDAVKNILTKVLLNDPEPSMRMQAFDKLTSQERSVGIDEYLSIAKRDTSEYLKNRSNMILNQLKENEANNLEESKPVKIMRKE